MGQFERPKSGQHADRIRALIVGVSACVLVMLRLALAGPFLDRMWAEDARVFLAEGRSPKALVETYAGYIHTLPRVVAALGSWLPPSWWTVYAAAAAAVAVGSLTAFVYLAALRTTRSQVPALIAASAMVLLPAARFESLGSIANLQWFLLGACGWALLLPRGVLQKTAVVVAATTALTTPLVVCLFPVVIVAHRRDALTHPAVRAAGFGLVIQLCVIVLSPAGSSSGVPRSPSMGGLARALITSLDGWDVSGAAAVVRSLLFLAGVGMVVATSRRYQTEAVAFTLSGLLILSVTTYVNGYGQARYAVAAGIAFASALALGADDSRLAYPGVALLGLAFAMSFPAALYRVSGPSWAESVQTWEALCGAEIGDGQHQHSLPLSPEGWGTVLLPCG